jgi:uncharacterized membrane protein
LPTSRGSSIRIASVGHAVFAAVFVAVGIQGVKTAQFTAVWQPVPAGVPMREALACTCAFLSLGAGVGLLFRRTQALAARVLLAALVVWLLVWRVRALFLASLIEGSWSFADTLVMTAGAWVLFAWFATDWDRRHLAFATGDRGVRIARALYGIGLIPFGYAHFANVKGTASLVPAWLPWHAGFAYFTGAVFIAAGAAILVDRFARLAAALSALQMGLFGLLVWVPILSRGRATAFDWLEFATTVTLTAAGWVVADSWRAASRVGPKD